MPRVTFLSISVWSFGKCSLDFLACCFSCGCVCLTGFQLLACVVLANSPALPGLLACCLLPLLCGYPLSSVPPLHIAPEPELSPNQLLSIFSVRVGFAYIRYPGYR